MTSINVIGCGRVGQTLARLLHLQGDCEIQDLTGPVESKVRNAAAFIGAGRAVGSIDRMKPADVWMLTVPDTLIQQVADQLAMAISSAAGQTTGRTPIAFHCSGFHRSAVMSSLSSIGFQVASVHPVLTFASPERAVEQFRGSLCGVEGDSAALEVLQPLFAAAGARFFPISAERKVLYHAAAVFSSNFTVVMQAIAREAYAAAGVPEGIALEMQQSMMRATLDNVEKLGPKAITGPAARGDQQVVSAQGAEVSQWHPHAGVVYAELSLMARCLAENQSTFPDHASIPKGRTDP